MNKNDVDLCSRCLKSKYSNHWLDAFAVIDINDSLLSSKEYNKNKQKKMS